MENGTSRAPFACTFCSKVYMHYPSLSRHKRDYHPSDHKIRYKPAAVSIRTLIRRASLPFLCPSCPKSFIHQTSLSRHRRDYHPDQRYAKCQPAVNRQYKFTPDERTTKWNSVMKPRCSPDYSSTEKKMKHGFLSSLEELCIVLIRVEKESEKKTFRGLKDQSETEEALLRKDLQQLVTAKESQKEGIVMWMFKEDPLDMNGFWYLVWSPDDPDGTDL